jgi:hypothetical protein
LDPKDDKSPRQPPQKNLVEAGEGKVLDAGEEKVLQAVKQYREAGATYEDILNFLRIGKDLWKSDPTSVLHLNGLSTNCWKPQQ